MKGVIIMAIDQEYIKQLNDFLDEDDDNPTEPEEEIVVERGIKGNITSDQIRSTEQALLYLVVDKSGSMYNNGLEDAVIKGLSDVKDVVNGSKEVNEIQTAMTFFGSSLDMRPFKYGEHIDISYEANEGETRLYDAVVESSKNMMSQYDKLEPQCKVKGVMFIFTDGGENGSKQHSLEDAKKILNEELKKKRDIQVLIAGFEDTGFSVKELGDDLGFEPVVIKDPHKLRRLMKFVSMNAGK